MGNCIENEGIAPMSDNGVLDLRTENDQVIDVYHFPPSPPSRAVLMVLHSLQLNYNIKPISLTRGDHKKPEFLKLNPLHTVPVINDKGYILFDSHVIMKYLIDKYGKDDSLLPNDPRKNALVNQKCYFSACYLLPAFLRYHAPTIFSNKPPSVEARKKLEDTLHYLDEFLENQIYVAGQDLSIADISIITIISNIKAAGSIDIGNYPNIWLWFHRTRKLLQNFGYDEINQPGANQFAKMYNDQLASSSKSTIKSAEDYTFGDSIE